MDIRKIKKLIDLLDETGVAEIAITEGEDSVRITRSVSTPQMMHPAMMVTPQMLPGATAPLAEPAPNNVPEPFKGQVIRSPMVGTFYRAPSPESSPFFEIGGMISKGETVCIIEAMKILNQIESEFSGKIIEVLIEDGAPVEFDQPLFIVQ